MMSVRPIGSMLANRASQAAVTIALLAIAFACVILVVGVIGAVRGADATSTIVTGAVFFAVAGAALFGASWFRRAHVRARTEEDRGGAVMSQRTARTSSLSLLAYAIVFATCFVVVAQLAPQGITGIAQRLTSGLITDTLTLPILWGMFMVVPLVALGGAAVCLLVAGTFRWVGER